MILPHFGDGLFDVKALVQRGVDAQQRGHQRHPHAGQGQNVQRQREKEQNQRPVHQLNEHRPGAAGQVPQEQQRTVFHNAKERQIQQGNLGQKVAEQAQRQDQADQQHHPGDHRGVQVRQMEQGENLDAEHHTGNGAGEQTLFQVAFPHPAVGLPPIARLVPQAAQDGIRHGHQLGHGDHAAHNPGKDHQQHRVGGDRQHHAQNKGQHPRKGQQPRAEKAPQIPAQNFQQAGHALFARRVGVDARTRAGIPVR